MEDGVGTERLAGIGLFADLSPQELARVAEKMRHLQVPTGSVIAEQDDVSSKFFVILEGSVTVHRGGHHVADLERGDFVGEAGTVKIAPRNATVIATTPVEAGVLMGWDLRDILDDMPALKARIDAANAERA